MLLPSGNVHRRSACAEIDRCGRRCVDVGGSASTVTQPSAQIITPTLCISVVENRAGVLISSRNGHGRAARAEVDDAGCGGIGGG